NRIEIEEDEQWRYSMRAVKDVAEEVKRLRQMAQQQALQIHESAPSLGFKYVDDSGGLREQGTFRIDTNYARTSFAWTNYIANNVREGRLYVVEYVYVPSDGLREEQDHRAWPHLRRDGAVAWQFDE